MPAETHTQSVSRTAEKGEIGQTGKGIEIEKHLKNQREKSAAQAKRKISRIVHLDTHATRNPPGRQEPSRVQVTAGEERMRRRRGRRR